MAFNKVRGYKSINTSETKDTTNVEQPSVQYLTKIEREIKENCKKYDFYTNSHNVEEKAKPCCNTKGEEIYIIMVFVVIFIFFLYNTTLIISPLMYEECNITHVDYPVAMPNNSYREHWNLCTFKMFSMIPWLIKNYSLWSPCIIFYTDTDNMTYPIYDLVHNKNGDRNCTLGCDNLAHIHSEQEYSNFIDWVSLNYTSVAKDIKTYPCKREIDYYSAIYFINFYFSNQALKDVYNNYIVAGTPLK